MPLKGQVLLKHIKIFHIVHDIAVFEDLEKFLVPDLPSLASKICHCSFQLSIFELELIFQRLRHIYKSHVNLLGLGIFAEVNIVCLDHILHDLLSCQERDHLQIAVLFLRVHDQDLGEQSELISTDFHASVADDMADSRLQEVTLPRLIFIHEA